MLAKAAKRVPAVKNIFKDLFRGKRLEGVPFLPYTFELAARVEQVALEQLRNDPGLLVNALLHTRQVIGGDVVLTRVDLAFPEHVHDGGVLAGNLLHAGIHGVSLEATRRLRETAGRQTVLACQITGPLKLIGNRLGQGKTVSFNDCARYTLENARQAVLQVIKVIGEIRPDLILIEENEVAPEGIDGAKGVAAYLEPLWNTIRYYAAEPLLVVQKIGNRVLELLAGEVSGIVFLNGADGYRLEELALLHGEKGVCFGLPVPVEIFKGRHELLEQFLLEIRNSFGCRGVFACSPGEIPPDSHVEHLKTMIEILKTT